MKLEQLKNAASFLKSKPEMNQSEKEMWSAIATPKQVLQLIERIELLEQQAQREAA